MQIVVNNILTDYSDSGAGKTIVCVHGWMHDQLTYKQLTEILSTKYRVIALDLPNFGKSQVTDTIQSIDDFAAFIAAFLDKLGVKDYVVVGHSMGAQIAIRGASQRLLKPEKMILIGAAGVRDKRKVYKLFLKTASKVFRHVTPKSIKNKFYNTIGSDYNPDLSDIHKQIINKTLTTDIQQDATKVTVPTLLIYGDSDVSTPPWMGEVLTKKIKHARLELIEGEQHWPHQTSAHKVAALMKDFLL